MVLLAALTLAALTGCGKSGSSGNGIASKSAEEIVSESKAAANAAGSVHVLGSLTSGGAPVKLDLNLVAGKGAQGEISQNGASFKLILVGGNTAVYQRQPRLLSQPRRLGGRPAVQRQVAEGLRDERRICLIQAARGHAPIGRYHARRRRGP